SPGPRSLSGVYFNSLWSLVAVSMSTIVIWDAAPWTERDFVHRLFGDFHDHLDLSRDGRWLAVLEGVGRGDEARHWLSRRHPLVGESNHRVPVGGELTRGCRRSAGGE